jgi:hypothetical protein
LIRSSTSEAGVGLRNNFIFIGYPLCAVIVIDNDLTIRSLRRVETPSPASRIADKKGTPCFA